MPNVSSSPSTILRAIVVSERKFWPRLCLALGRLLFQRAAEVMPCRQVVRGSGSLGAVRSEMDASQPRMLAGSARASGLDAREETPEGTRPVNIYGTCRATLVTSEDGSRGHPRGRRWEVCSASLVRSQADGARVAVLVRSLAHLE